MLAEMRQLTRSWLARGLLILISILLAVSLFQVDFQSGLQGLLNPNSVAVVAGRPISPQELDRRFQIFLKNANRSGERITQADAVKNKLHTRMLESLVQERAMFAYADRLGVQSSDRVVGQAIHSMPAFRDPSTQTFSKMRYEQLLQENVGMSPAAFEEQLRAELSAQQVINALTDGVRAPRSFGEMALALRSETRVASIAQIPVSRIGEIPEPTDAQVQQVYAEIAPRAFRVPSYRAVTIVSARLSDFTARVNIPEERIRELFETNKAGFSQPEKRSFVQIVAQTNAQANQAAQRLARGEDAAAIARALNLQHIAFAQKARTEIPDPAVARAVFAMRAGAAPQAVRAEVAPYAAIKLGDIVPGVEARYEEHRDELRDELARQEAQGLREEAITAFTDALDAGTPIAQAAAAHGLSATVVPAVDEQGRTPNGQPAEAFLDEPDLVRTAFETEQGETSDFFPAQGGDETLLQVDNVTPERTLPLAQVRAQVVEYWKGRERSRRLSEMGQRVVQAVNGGRSFADAVAAEGGTIFARSEVVRRQDAARTITQLFSVREGEAAMAVNPTATVVLVAQVEEIRRANPSEQAAAVEEMRREAQQGLVQSLGEAIQRSTENAAKVKRFPSVLERQYSRGDTQDQ